MIAVYAVIAFLFYGCCAILCIFFVVYDIQIQVSLCNLYVNEYHLYFTLFANVYSKNYSFYSKMTVTNTVCCW